MKTKNLIGMMAMAIAMAGCQKETGEVTEEVNIEPIQDKISITFSVGGDFELTSLKAMSRGLAADGKDMTDLWVMDYVGGALVQQLHQTSGDEGFGSPTIALDYGSHHLYFVCSRGTGPTLSTDEHKITWATTSDTFYKDYGVEVTSGSATSRNVTLERVATKLRISILDQIPEGTAKIELTPATWYYGIDYISGEPTSAISAGKREINIPSQYIGTTGEVTTSIFGISSATEWTTDVSIVARNGSDEVLGQATITDAPFVANRVTNYSGNLFSAGGSFALMLSTTWAEEYNGTW